MNRAHTTTIAERVKAASLTAAERRICNVLLENYPAAGLEPVAQFARSARASHPTVLRFIEKLGFSSYGEFQQSLRTEVVDRFQTLPQRYDVYKKSRKGTSALEDYLAAVDRNLHRALAMIPPAHFERVGALLADTARTIYLAGSGLTYPLAAWFFNFWKQLRPAVHYINPGARPHTYLLDLRERDIVVLFQMPRYERDMIAFGLEVVRRGSTLILFTDKPSSALAAKATYTFASPISVPSVFDSYMGSILQLEILTTVVVQHMGDRYRERAAALEGLIPASSKVHDLKEEAPA